MDDQPRKRRELETKINDNGGMVLETEANVDTILVSSAMPPGELDWLKMQYACSQNAARRKIYVERSYFINQCIVSGTIGHSPRLPGGSVPVAKTVRRAGRIEFNDDDDWNLAYYIAQRRPDKRAQGRSGNRIYQDLAEMEHAWVDRHTWSSWREHYVKKKAQFDPVIDEIYEYLNGERYTGARERFYAARNWRVPASDEEEDIDIEVEDVNSDDQVPVQRRRPDRSSRGGRQQGRRPAGRQETLESSSEYGTTAAENVYRQDKGKGRAQPPPVHEEEEDSPSDSQRDSLFGDQMNAQGDDDDSIASIPEIRPTQTSQRTLVGTPPRSAGTQSTRHPINRNAVPGPSQVVNENAGVSAPPPKTSQHRPTQKSKTVRSLDLRTQAKRVDDYNPPYRNTRSRSGSVEPLSSLTNAHTRSRKNQTIPAVPMMPEIAEVDDNEESLPVGETLQEEQAVVEHLFDEDQSMAASEGLAQNDQGPKSRMQKEPYPRDEENMSSDIDSDDKQTRDNLKGSSSSTIDDVFGPVGDVGSLSHRQLGRRLRGNQGDVPAVRKVARRGGALATGRRAATSLTTPVHPHQARQAAAGAATEAVFPSPGTRAYQVRKHLENQAKNTDYVPPAGTRAAALKK